MRPERWLDGRLRGAAALMRWIAGVGLAKLEMSEMRP
jgi:hypothetical protein